MKYAPLLRAGFVLAALGLAAASHATTLTRATAFEYDPITGLLTKEMVEPDHPELCVVTTYAYDAFGKRTGATTRNCNGSAGSHPGINSEAAAPAAGNPALFETRSSSSAYSANARFVASSTNGLGHSESSQFDETVGALTEMTGPNGLTTRWSYDAFGRKVLEERADGSGTRWEYLYCAGVAGGTTPCPSVSGVGAKTTVVTTPVVSADVATGAYGAPNGPVSRVYFDSLGREIRSETQGFDGSGTSTAIYLDTRYDTLGRVIAKSVPYFAGGTVYWNTFTYDVLGRRLTETSRNDTDTADSTTSYVYSGLTVTTTNAKGQVTTSVTDVMGRKATVTDHHGKSLAYTYDAFGNLTSTTDSVGNVISLTYDQRGRKVGMDDPDMGVWSYVYNALGELVGQTDSLAQTTVMRYDILGRMTERLEPDLQSFWYYDTRADGTACGPTSIGKLCEAVSDNGYRRLHTYDTLGRPTDTATTIDNLASSYVSQVAYDAQGRVDTQTWPSGLVVKNVYTAMGFLKEVRQTDATGQLYWRADHIDAVGRLTQQTYGNGVSSTQSFYGPTGRPQSILAGTGNSVQDLHYQYDTLGNLTNRTDVNQGLIESFQYDSLNRLTRNTINAAGFSPAATTQYAYDELGNLTCKGDLSTCSAASANMSYGATVTLGGVTRTLPHAVSSVIGTVRGELNPTYTYDANGNMVQGGGLQYVYTSFNMPQAIGAATYSAGFRYGPEHQRVMQVTTASTVVYLHPDQSNGLYYEKEIRGTTTSHKHYIAGAAVVTLTDTQWSTRYLHRDHLGSVTTITDETGTVLERMAYDPWGKRRFPSGEADPDNTIRGDTTAQFVTNRGFTNHEHLDGLGLIHMNGRIFDPVLARFTSADPHIQLDDNLQSYNRYSYVLNNPLTYTDPTGFFIKKLFKSIKKAIKKIFKNPVIRMVATIAIAYFTGQWVGGLFDAATLGTTLSCTITATNIVTGMAGGFAGALVATNGDLKAAAQGAITGAAFGLVGSTWAGGSLGNYAGHAVVGCASSTAQGGSCARGAAAQFASKWATINTNGNPVAAVVAGGAVSVIGGGKFANGAMTATAGYLFNQAVSAMTAPRSLAQGAGSLRGGVLGMALSLRGDSSQEYLYATYTRVHPDTGEVYSGRTGGYSDPETLVHQRGLGQGHLNDEGFGPPRIDQWTTDYQAIRGREQMLIDYYGGAQSVGGSARNMINGVADFNPNRPYYMNAARGAFGELPDNSPPRIRFGN